MNIATLDILRCPYCGGRLELVASLFHQCDGDEVQNGILGCQCCTFGIVDGIPVMHLDGSSAAARAHLEAGRPDLARRAMFNLTDGPMAARFEEVASSDTATYRAVVDALGTGFEGGYFLYRFSDPTYLVADAVVRAVAGTVLRTGGRAVDLCGGSGHLTRTLMELSTEAPVLADLYFSKVWLARRFTAPGCEGVCCDGNGPLPFGRGAFRYAMCTDAFMFIWTKRLFVGEMERLVAEPGRGGADPAGAIVIGHAHNERTWSASHGQPLSHDGYRDLFETIEPRIFAEAGLFAEVVAGGPLDLARHDSAAEIDADPALTIVATGNPEVFKRHALTVAGGVRGELRLNPLYVVQPAPGGATLRLRFPDRDYEDEYGACRRYLPDEINVGDGTLAALAEGRTTAEIEALVRRRVVLDLPRRYY